MARIVGWRSSRCRRLAKGRGWRLSAAVALFGCAASFESGGVMVDSQSGQLFALFISGGSLFHLPGALA